MSITRTIQGKIFITDFQVANEAIKNFPTIKITNNLFSLVTIDEYSSNIEELYKVEAIYREMLLEKQHKQEEERKRLEEERKKLEEEKRIIENQAEFLNQLIELEKRLHQNKQNSIYNESEIYQREQEEKKVLQDKEKYRNEREAQIIANAQKKGFIVKKRITENNKVKLILQRRDF